MTESFWLEDAKIAILTDSPIEGLDMADMAASSGYGPAVLLRKSSALVCLLCEGEFRPRLVVLSRSLDTQEVTRCVDACKSANAGVILVDNDLHADFFEPSCVLNRPFTFDDLKAAFSIVGLWKI